MSVTELFRKNSLEVRTVLTFVDEKEEECQITYKGFLNFQEGDIINVVRT